MKPIMIIIVAIINSIIIIIIMNYNIKGLTPSKYRQSS